MDEPSSYKEAITSTKATKWKESIESDIQSMYYNKVWHLVDPTPSIKSASQLKDSTQMRIHMIHDATINIM